MKKIILLLIIFSLGCDQDPILGLKRGWIIDNIFVLDHCDEDILNQPCNITTTTTGTKFELVPFDIQGVNHPKTIYNNGDLYYFKISGNSYPIGTFSYYLYHNETLINYYTTGSMGISNATWPDLSLSVHSSTNQLELPSNCFTIRFVDTWTDEIYVTEPFAICP
jgi:hypothetical protein